LLILLILLILSHFFIILICQSRIIYSAKIDCYYVGSTLDLVDRLNRHNSGKSTYTKRGIPWIVVYQKTYSTKSEAYQAELYIKSQKSRKYIEELIAEQSV
jgi:putative endonuclease